MSTRSKRTAGASSDGHGAAKKNKKSDSKNEKKEEEQRHKALVIVEDSEGPGNGYNRSFVPPSNGMPALRALVLSQLPRGYEGVRPEELAKGYLALHEEAYGLEAEGSNLYDRYTHAQVRDRVRDWVIRVASLDELVTYLAIIVELNDDQDFSPRVRNIVRPMAFLADAFCYHEARANFSVG